MVQCLNLAEAQCRTIGWISLLFFTVLSHPIRAGDAEALLSLKSSIDPENLLPWEQASTAMVCSWLGVKLCVGDRVTKLVLEFHNLSGSLEGESLSQLRELRVLSFKGNLLTGSIPNLSNLSNLKSLFLNDNHLSGEIPASISSLHRLKVVVLSNNHLNGSIPQSITTIPRLFTLSLENNHLEGAIPPLNQSSLTFFNVSNNNLSGQIPSTFALSLFNSTSFSGNPKLCGFQTENLCDLSPAPSPSAAIDEIIIPGRKRKRKHLIPIIAGSVGGFILLLLLLGIAILAVRKTRTRTRARSRNPKRTEKDPEVEEKEEENRNAGEGFSWDREGLGSLIFIGNDPRFSYSLEDLLKASAETLGRGSIGSTYKAVLESGFIVTVKRLKDASYPTAGTFQEQMSYLGQLRHPNLVPLRAYFQTKEERLLVYDYFPNGSLHSLLHGARASNKGKPLHWTSCLKIADDVAAGLLHLHQNSLLHGNLKSSNILLGAEFESCITDYALCALHDPDSGEESSGVSIVYAAPETRGRGRKAVTRESDVYSFGVVLLELLTGKVPYDDMVESGSIVKWVRGAREEDGEDPPSGNEGGDEKLRALVGIAVACVSRAPDSRPSSKDVVRMIGEARGDMVLSPNSSDHSPGRWSDTIVSVPTEHFSM